MRWQSVTILVLLLVALMAAALRPSDKPAQYGPANFVWGAGHAAAAGVATPAAQQATPVASPRPATQAGPAANKGDGNDFDVRRPPSIDAAGIARVLESYGSPAVGAAQTIYQLGVHYGIDPAFCLAFFIHESSAGTQGVARVTKSVGNIRATPGYRDYHGYRQYDSWEQGIDDWYRLIDDLYINQWGLTTVDEIIPVYAPASDGNDPNAYIAAVKQLVTSWRGR